MGYFDGLGSGPFKRNKSGQIVFYPWGIAGRGYVIPDEATEARVRKFVRSSMQLSIPAIIGAQVVSGPALSLSIFAGFVLWFAFRVRTLVGSFPLSPERLTLKEHAATSAKAYGKPTLWFLLTCSVIMLAAALFLVFVGRSIGDRMIALACILLFGAAAMLFGYMLRVRRS